MDSHIKVAKGWLDQPYELMKKDYRTMVSPVVFIMDQEHFEFQPGRNGLMRYKYYNIVICIVLLVFIGHSVTNGDQESLVQCKQQLQWVNSSYPRDGGQR